jgi:HlyD family secretion protein
MIQSTQFRHIAAGLIMPGALLWNSGCGSSVATEQSGVSATYEINAVEPNVRVQPVESHTIRSRHEFTGNLLPRRRIQVSAEVTGVVAEIPQLGTSFDVEVNGQHYVERLGIGPGHVVKQGDVLLKINPTDFELEVAVAKAKLGKAEADLKKRESWKRPEEIWQLQAGRDEALARHKNAADQLQRSKDLLNRKAMSESEYAVRVSDATTSKAALDSQEAMLALAEAGPTHEELAVQQALVHQAAAELEQKQRQLEKAVITAPADSVVTQFSVEVGDHIGPSFGTIVELLDVRFLIAETGVPESMLGRVNIKDLADVKLAGTDNVVTGMVVAINGKIDPESRTFRVRVAIDNASGQFKAGQFASVVFKSGLDEESACVPENSLIFIEGQPHVFVVDESSVAHLRSVKIGESEGSLIQVSSGVSIGERVVVEDAALIADGMSVKVQE